MLFTQSLVVLAKLVLFLLFLKIPPSTANIFSNFELARSNDHNNENEHVRDAAQQQTNEVPATLVQELPSQQKNYQEEPLDESRYDFATKNKDGLIIIVGISTLCARSSVVHKSVDSFIHQDRPPDHIYVHLFCSPNNTTSADDRSHLSSIDQTAHAIISHPLVTVGETNACRDRGPGSKLLCTLAALEKTNVDPKRTVIILGDDDHIYWNGALRQMEEAFINMWRNKQATDAAAANETKTSSPLSQQSVVVPKMALTFFLYHLNRLPVAQGADLFALPLLGNEWNATLSFYECVIKHQPRLQYHDDAWISLMMWVRDIYIYPLRSNSPWDDGHVVYTKADKKMTGLYESKTEGLERGDLQKMVGKEWKNVAKNCGNTLSSNVASLLLT